MTHARSNAPSMPTSMLQACAKHTAMHGAFNATGQDRTGHKRGVVQNAPYLFGVCAYAAVTA